MRRGPFVQMIFISAVVLAALLTGQPAAAREPIDLLNTIKLADELRGKVADDDWRMTVRLVNGMVRAVLLRQPIARPPCNDLELVRKMHIALTAGRPIVAMLETPNGIGFASVIDGNRAEFLFSCNYQTSISTFRPWLDKAAPDEQAIALMADLVTDDFDIPAPENRDLIRRCIAANSGGNTVVSAFCDGPPAGRGGSFFIGIAAGNHKWE